MQNHNRFLSPDPAVNDQLYNNLLSEIREKYGYDFTDYSFSSVKRRVHYRMIKSHIKCIYQFSQKVLTDKSFFADFSHDFSITVTSMFRDPKAFLYLRKKVLPYLATYPTIRIWSAGAATGEEAFSLAIMLHEEGLLQRSVIYATDFSPQTIQWARRGHVSLKKMAQYSSNYFNAGGKTALHKYFKMSRETARIKDFLKKKIVFATHHLGSDGVFNTFNLILCRNVLIYFNERLIQKSLRQFADSLEPMGFLWVGLRENLNRRSGGKYYHPVCKKNKIYQKMYES